ncbi:carbohydrate binding domain-containing protein [Iodobacter fluviatilis]|uniref:Uncharacterized protein n=1 Tax=Iodobacter fluviatilis TaxID=537 RepID=A0A377Q8W6_9NEIS|nr:carbohydrate binding domain-containing protein [Iodobacter fluviatilis]TCU81210.1 hypothetical protein EV682_12513 [Iodobacter fluviatilis]STQ91726.1 Uncharacterised protein [Iodobacter fluviatilis]
MTLESAIADQTTAVTALTQAVNNKMEAIDLLVANKVSSLGSGTFKNKLINGNFDIWQRGTSKDWTINGGYGSADRWCFGSGMGPATVSFSQTTGPIEKVPSARYGLRVQIKNPDVSAPTPWLKQNIESVASFAGCKVTLSFYMRADVARTIYLSLEQVFGSGGVTSELSATAIQPVQITSEWKKYSATFDLPAIVGKKLGSNGDDRLGVCFNFPVAASTYFIDIAQVQLEEGAIATAFEQRPIGLELFLCQRYFEKSFVSGVPIQAGNGLPSGGFCFPALVPAGQSCLHQVKYAVQKRNNNTAVTFFSPGVAAVSSVSNWSKGTHAATGTISTLSKTEMYFSFNFIAPPLTVLGDNLTVEWTADCEL